MENVITGDTKKDTHRDQKAHYKHRDRAKNNRQSKQDVQPRTTLDAFNGSLPELAGFIYTYDGYARASQFRNASEKIVTWTK